MSSRLARFFEYLCVYVLSFAWCALFQPWGAFLDPDGFTHAKIAALIMQRGFLQDFPWLDLTILHTSFVDQHLGLHVLLIPFIKIFGLLPGAQLAGVLFAALAITIFYRCARFVGSTKPWLWTFLLITASPFIVRMSLAKSSPLAVACFLVGISALVCLKKRQAFLAGLVFSLVHGGWLLLVAAQTLVAGAMMAWQVLRRLLARIRLVEHIPESQVGAALKVLGTTVAGCVFGVLLHPNAKNIFRFLWVQVGVIGIQTPFDRVRLGEEWRAIQLGQMLVTIPLFILVAGVVLIAFRKRSQEVSSEERVVPASRPTLLPRVFVPLITIFLGVLTLKSKRYGEYFIPTLALTGAMFEAELRLRLVDLREAWASMVKRTRISLVAIAILLVTSSVIDLKDTYVSLHQNNTPFGYVDAPMKALSTIALPGERVFHPQWDLFPALLVANDRLRYVSGMDPTYLFVASTTRSDIYADFVVDQATSTNLYAFIHQNLGANYIIFERARNPNLEKRLEQDQQFSRVYQDATFAVYRVQEIPEKKLSTVPAVDGTLRATHNHFVKT